MENLNINRFKTVCELKLGVDFKVGSISNRVFTKEKKRIIIRAKRKNFGLIKEKQKMVLSDVNLEDRDWFETKKMINSEKAFSKQKLKERYANM